MYSGLLFNERTMYERSRKIGVAEKNSTIMKDKTQEEKERKGKESLSEKIETAVGKAHDNDDNVSDNDNDNVENYVENYRAGQNETNADTKSKSNHPFRYESRYHDNDDNYENDSSDNDNDADNCEKRECKVKPNDGNAYDHCNGEDNADVNVVKNHEYEVKTNPEGESHIKQYISAKYENTKMVDFNEDDDYDNDFEYEYEQDDIEDDDFDDEEIEQKCETDGEHFEREEKERLVDDEEETRLDMKGRRLEKLPKDYFLR